MLRGRTAGLALFALGGLFAAIAARPAQDRELTVLLGGDTDGYIAPCGCTSPMTGGLKRRATALKEAGAAAIVLDNGSLSGGIDRQNVIKAETAAQSLEATGAAAANLSWRDSALGRGELLSLLGLSKGRIVSTSVETGSSVAIDPWRKAGPFLIGGATSRPETLSRNLGFAAVSAEEAAHRLVDEAAEEDLVPILLFDGDREAAARLAQAVPKLRLVTYRYAGHPKENLDLVGECALATPGERGKTIARLVWSGGRFVAASIQELGPSVKDDSKASELYKTYLRRVSSEHLLEKVARSAGPRFAGSEKCGSCHQSAMRVWRSSGHAHALATLEHEGHERDPDCVSCHVVGLKFKTGFRSRSATPNLAFVGCESCHGGGAAHASAPLKVRLPKVTEISCRSCHSLENSPKFDFDKYWPKIRHGYDRLQGSKGKVRP